MLSKRESDLKLAAPVSGTSPSQLALPDQTLLLLASPILGIRTLNGATKRCWDSSHLWVSPSAPGKGPGKEVFLPQEHSSHSQAGFGRDNLQEKCPHDVPSLSLYQARPLGPGPLDSSSHTTVSCPANPDFLPAGITQRQGLASAQTVSSTASHTGEGGSQGLKM